MRASLGEKDFNFHGSLQYRYRYKCANPVRHGLLSVNPTVSVNKSALRKRLRVIQRRDRWGLRVTIYTVVLALALMMQLSCNRNDSSVSNSFQLIHFSPSAESLPDFVTAFRGEVTWKQERQLFFSLLIVATYYLGRTLDIIIQVNHMELFTFACTYKLQLLIDCFSLEFRYEGSDDWADFISFRKSDSVCVHICSSIKQ